MVDEELEEGLRAMAAPIHDPRGKVIAAVNVSAPTRRGEPETLRRELLPQLLTAASRIEEDLGAVAHGRGGHAYARFNHGVSADADGDRAPR